jgi:hypothetical protein
MKNKKKYTQTRQGFLLTFFEDRGQEDKQVNGFWLVKHWNGNSNTWEVAIYTEEAYRNYSSVSNKQPSLDWIQNER